MSEGGLRPLKYVLDKTGIEGHFWSLHESPPDSAIRQSIKSFDCQILVTI